MADARRAGAQMTLRIGLTGPIGCGKSTIAGWLREMGGAVIDADELAREVTAPGEEALDPIRERFGDGVFHEDGALDRSALAALVFSDEVALRELERTVHPRVRRRVTESVASAEVSGAPFVVIEAIKLVQGGYGAECDEVWLVECAPDVQLARLVARGMDPADAERRIATQGPDLAERLAPAATWRLSTDGSPDDVRHRVGERIWSLLRAP